jgi:ribosome biogenesis protein Nip4
LKVSLSEFQKLFGVHVKSVEIKGKYFFYDGDIVGDPYSVGIYLGEGKDDFSPSPALVDMIAKRSSCKVYVNDKAEWLFLCGRDVFRKSVEKGKLIDGKFVLVQNSMDENLGFGKVQGDVIENYLDKGAYLRMER